MEATLKSPSPSTTDLPDWKKWQSRWLDGEWPEFLCAEAKQYSPGAWTPLGLSMRLSKGMELTKRFCECCGSLAGPLSEKGFGTSPYFGRTWKEYSEKTGGRHYWPNAIGIFAFEAPPKRVLKFFDNPKDGIAVELLDDDKTITLFYREVFDAENV